MIMGAFFGTSQNVPVQNQDGVCEVKDITNKFKFVAVFIVLPALNSGESAES